MNLSKGSAMRAIKRSEDMRSFAGMLIAYECSGPIPGDVAFVNGARFGIVSKSASVVTGGGEVGYFLSRLVSMAAVDSSLQLTQSNLSVLDFRCRVVSFDELRNVKGLDGYSLAKFERRSQGASLAFLEKFGREIGLQLEDEEL